MAQILSKQQLFYIFVRGSRKLFPQSTTTNNVPHFARHLTSTANRYQIFNVQDEDDFKEKVVKSKIPVIVDFHASWCGPCKLLGPRLERVIGSKGDKVHLAKVDIDSLTEIAMEYQVSAVPAVMCFKDGKVCDNFVGLLEEAKIEAFVNRITGD